MNHLLPTRLRCPTAAAAAAALCAALAAPASAQSTPTSPGVGSSTDTARRDRTSWIPYTTRGYVGVNVGKAEYDTPCAALFDCDDPKYMAKVYTGGLFNDVVGLELGFVDFGKADRNGGSTRARGANISAVARLPFGGFNVFGKVGTTYGRTRVSASPLALNVEEGRDSGWGGAVAAGIGYDFTPNAGVVLEWERHEMHFAGLGREKVEAASVGLIWRF